MKLIIIGAGPAGISAGLYAKRSGIDTTIIYHGQTALEKAHEIDNYYGVSNCTGLELYEIGLEQAKNLNIEMFKDEVVGIEFGEKFIVATKTDHLEADAIIIATGSNRNTPRVKNIQKFAGKGVSYCATCDGFFYRQKNIAVLGNASYCVKEARYLKNLTDKLTVYTNGLPIEDDELNEFNVVTDKIKEVTGNERIEKIILENGNENDVDGLFIALGSAGSVEFAHKLGLEVENGRIVTNENMATNIPGIYACGDCAKGMLQIAKAVYEGALAATDASKFLKTKELNSKK